MNGREISPPEKALEVFEPNLVGLCNVHHLVGIHGGYIRVSGTAPSGLVWELGGRIWMSPERWARPVWKT